MTEARFTRAVARQFNASWFAVLALASVALFCAGCDSKQQADESTDEQPATAPADVPETARTIQLKNIAANRGVTGLQAIRALANSKAPGAFEVIAPALRDKSLMCRIYSATSLGTLGDPRALPLLRKALQSKYIGLRLGAVVGLGELGPAARPAVKQIGAMLDKQFPPMHASVKHANPDENYSERRSITLRIHLAALKALGQLGGPEAQAIVADVYKKAQDADRKWASARALKTMDAREVLRGAGSNGSAGAWQMLGELNDTASFTPLVQCARNPKLPGRLRSEAIHALGRLQDRRATPMLLGLLRSKSDTICRAAAWSLNRMADPESLPRLLAYVKSAPLGSAGLYSATCAIGKIETPAALEALRQLGRHPSSSVRGAVAYRLDERATIQDMPLLVRLLRNPLGSDHVPTKALTRLLPDSAQPLLDLLPRAEPELQIKIARILATHEPARPALRALLKSENEIVRNSMRHILWGQRDPSVSLGFMFTWGWGEGIGKRDIPELKRLVSKGDSKQSFLALTHLFDLDPKAAWVHIRPMFYGKLQSSTPYNYNAYNIIGEDYPDWLEQEMVGMLKQPEGLSTDARRQLLKLLRKGNSISPEAVAIYRLLAGDGDIVTRSAAYECLCKEASDESMAFVARKALEGDHPARWAVGGTRDKRLAGTFGKLVKEATEKKDTWVGGYVHCWPTVPGVVEYVDRFGSHYSEQLMKARKTLAETVPD